MKSLIKNALWQGLRRATGNEVVPLRVLSGPARGAVLNLDLRTQGSYWLGNYDHYAAARIPVCRYLRRGDTAWDCGSFVGFYAAIFRKLVGPNGLVAVFEGSAANFDHLRSLPLLNGWKNVSIYHRAVGPDHTDIEFAGASGGASGPAKISPRFKSIPAAKTEMVRCFGIDELVFEAGMPKPGVIKLDLEGAEAHALHNGIRIFSECRPILLLEMHGSDALDATARFLDDYGYCATPAQALEKFASVSESRWLTRLRDRAFMNGKSLADSGGTPQMMLVLPREHPDLNPDLPLRKNQNIQNMGLR